MWDTYNNLSGEKMDLLNWINFCANGFIRQNRYITIKLDDIEDINRETPHKYLEMHETKNHHDHNIFNQDKALAEIYNNSKGYLRKTTMLCHKVLKELVARDKWVVDAELVRAAAI